MCENKIDCLIKSIKNNDYHHRDCKHNLILCDEFTTCNKLNCKFTHFKQIIDNFKINNLHTNLLIILDDKKEYNNFITKLQNNIKKDKIKELCYTDLFLNCEYKKCNKLHIIDTLLNYTMDYLKSKICYIFKDDKYNKVTKLIHQNISHYHCIIGFGEEEKKTLKQECSDQYSIIEKFKELILAKSKINNQFETIKNIKCDNIRLPNSVDELYDIELNKLYIQKLSNDNNILLFDNHKVNLIEQLSDKLQSLIKDLQLIKDYMSNITNILKLIETINEIYNKLLVFTDNEKFMKEIANNCNICYTDYPDNKMNCCNKIMCNKCITNHKIVSYQEGKDYSCPFCRQILQEFDDDNRNYEN